MKIPMFITRVQAGRIEDNNMLYASAFVLDDTKKNVNEPDRLDVGQDLAKVSLNTDNNNALAKRLASSNLIGSQILVTVISEVKKNILTMKIIDFAESK